MSNKLSLLDICKKCGSRCCKEPGPPVVFPEEVERIREFCQSKGLGDHIEKVEGEEFYTIPRRGKPCPYLDSEDRCSIQDVKPLDCRVYPIGLTDSLRTGISTTCPAKNLLTSEYTGKAKSMLNTLSPGQMEAFVRFSLKAGYSYTERPDNYGYELLLDLYGCDREILESKEHLKRYNKEIVRLIDMEAMGLPVIPEKFGKGTLHGYSSVQFIQTSSIVVHLCEDLLEAHVNIFSCKRFDEMVAQEFTSRFFDAQKSDSRLILR